MYRLFGAVLDKAYRLAITIRTRRTQLMRRLRSSTAGQFSCNRISRADIRDPARHDLFDDREAALDITSARSVANPLTSDVLKTLRCPSTMVVLNQPDSGPPPGLPRGALPVVRKSGF